MSPADRVSHADTIGGVEAPYRSSVDDVMAAAGVDPHRGLAQEEAEARLARHGPNELAAEKPVPAWRRLLAQFQGPLTLLLIVATAVSLLVWTIERESPLPYEALTILAVLLLNAGMGYVQEGRAEQALSALRRLSAAHAEVLRDGERRRVPAASLVPGDVLLLEEGSTVPADARVFEAVALQTVEAALTGESTPVTKDVAPIPMEVGLGDRTNMVLSGTLVSYGRGRAVVTATGAHTEIGAVAGLLSRTPAEETPLQRELAHVGRLLGRIVVAIALVMAATIVLVQQVRTVPALVSVLLLAVALAVAAVPEGLTAITTIVLSLGTERMARRRVIIRKLSAVQALGSATVICSDKTGTLTKNEMTVRVAITAGGRTDFTGTGYAPEGELRREARLLEDPAERADVERLLRAAVLASNATLSEGDGRWEVLGDPTEGALVVAARKAGVVAEDLAARFRRVGEIPFSSERKLMSTAQTDKDRGGRTVLVSKGAPDILLARCTHESVGKEDRPLTAGRRQAILATVEGLAAEALRTLGVAFRVLEREDRPGFGVELERELVWLGLVGMIDPPRPEAQKAVQEARDAGIRTIMITGDHPATAAAIAVELGIVPGGARALAGPELSAMGAGELERAVREVSVYARVSPEHKLRIVEALQKQGEVVAMTGDGVNDAPALKRADIGVAMGISGTDVSKGAADMVLADDNFASIVAAVEEGRGIYGNIQKFLRFLLSSNVGEVMVMFFGVVFAGAIGLRAEAGEPLVLPLLATMILWVNLLTDSGPALALGMDAADPHAMRRPPRDPRRPAITPAMWRDILARGAVMAVATLLAMDAVLPGGLVSGSGTMAEARTVAFTTLVLAQLVNVFCARSDEASAFRGLLANPWLWLAVVTSALLQLVVVYVPGFQKAFATVSLDAWDWVLCLAAASSVLWSSEIIKLVRRHGRAAGTTAVLLGVLAAPTSAPADSEPAAPAPLASVCNVRDYGATGVRRQNATRPVQEAVDACHARGGGTAYVPPGEYTTGTIVLKDNVTLWLEAGAVFYLSQDRADFPGARAHVFADGARNVAIRGRGRFDGQARYEWGPAEDQDTEILEETRIAERAGVDMRRWLRRGLQAMTFVFKQCRDVLVEDVTLVNSTLWNVRLWGCDGVVMRGVTIESDLEKAANSDGIDVDGSRNVRISDCRIATADDAIVLKTGKWRWDGRGESFPTENVVVTNCVLSSSSAAFTIGTESYEDFRHIVLSNSVVRDSNRAFGINIQDGATVEDVLIANVTVDLGRRHWNWWGSAELLHFVLKKRTPESRLGTVRNVVVEDVVAHVQGTSHIAGHAERPIENVTLSGIQLFLGPESTPDKRATHALVAEGVDRLRIRDLDVRWAEDHPEAKWQSAVVVRKARDVELAGFVGGSAPGTTDVPAVVLEDVDGALVRACRPLSGLFLQVAGSSRAIRLVGNDFSAARVPVSYASEDLRAVVASEGNLSPRQGEP